MFGFHRRMSFPLPDVRARRGRGRAGREFDVAVRAFERDVAREFCATCVYLKVGVKVEAAAGPTFRVPRVGAVLAGPPTVLTVEMLPGQVPGDLAEPGHRLAELLGARGLRVERIAARWVRLVVLDPDPPVDPVDDHRQGPRRVLRHVRRPGSPARGPARRARHTRCGPPGRVRRVTARRR